MRVEQAVGTPLGDRADLGGGDREEVADDTPAERRGSSRTTPRVRRAAPSGCRSPSELGAGDPLGVPERVACRAGHLGRAAQRVGVLDAGIAVRGDWRRSQSRRATRAGWWRWRPAPAAGAARRSSAANARSVPSSASTDIAAAMSATLSSAPRSAHASTSIPSIPSVPLISARPSFGPSAIGSIPARRSQRGPPGPDRRDPPAIPRRSAEAHSARAARGPRSHRASRARARPASVRRSAAPGSALRPPGRAPEHPIASDRARSSIIARTTSRSTGGPIPAACERTSAR